MSCPIGSKRAHSCIVVVKFYHDQLVNYNKAALIICQFGHKIHRYTHALLTLLNTQV